MYLKDIAFGIINGAIPATPDDQLEAYQFVVDNGYTEDLTPKQTLFLRELVESGKVETPVLVLGL